MQGSVAISPSPIIMESLIFRQKLGLCLSASVHQVNNNNNNNNYNNMTGSVPGGCAATARCLFGPPDPKQAKDLVKEVELKNALNFGKRFNFDIVAGEPFPHAKKMKMSHEESDNSPSTIVNDDDSDEENVAILEADEEEDDHEGYIWTETYYQDYMAMCNRDSRGVCPVGPNRHAVSLLIAPILPGNHLKSFYSSSLSSTISSVESPGGSSSSSSEEQLIISSSSEQDSSDKSLSSASTSPAVLARSHSETNNNIMDDHSNKRNEDDNSSAKRNNNNRIINNSQKHHQPSAKNKSSSFPAAHQILNRVLKHTVMKKKPPKSIITDYLQMRRTKNESNKEGKK